VFQENGGFDICIGNPPYVQIQKFARTQIQKDLEKAKYETFAKT
jgi:methylase of polypeptide subunit release factors